MAKYAVIVAGGAGTRMESAVPKQFLMLHDKPVLYYTIKTFLDTFHDLKVILVLPEVYMEMGREIIDAWFDYDRIQLTAGGETRFHSVKAGLQLVREDGIVFVHDGVRCLVSPQLIQRCYDAAVAVGSAIPVVPVKDSLRMLGDDDSQSIDRNSIVIVQTPQTFHSKILLPAFEIDYKERFTDEASVVEAFGLKISLVHGEDENIKITRPADLLAASALLAERMKQPVIGSRS